MPFEFKFLRPSPEEEQEIRKQNEEVKENLRAQNPDRFTLFEKFLSFDKKTLRLLPPGLEARYVELGDDWFSISDACDRMGGEERYRELITDIEVAIGKRREIVGSLKKRMVEVGQDRLRAYFNMHQAEDDAYERGLFAMLDVSKDQSALDKYSFELVDKILQEVEAVDVAVVDQWIEAKKIADRQSETKRLKAEKTRILQWLQKMYGKEWDVIVKLCQKLNLVKETPKNGEMLNQLQPQELLALEKRFRDVEDKFRGYDMHLYSSSEEDLETVIEEVLQLASEQL